MKTVGDIRTRDNATRARQQTLLARMIGSLLEASLGAPRVFAYLAIALLFLSAPAFASIPQTINIHGKLINASDGSGIEGTNTVNFTFYDAFSGGSIIYSEPFSVTSDDQGVFTTILSGINTTFPDQYYLALHLPGESEMSPRVNLTSAPSAYRANISEDLACTDCVDGSDLADTITLDAATTIVGTDSTDFAVNVSTLYVDFSTGRVGIGTSTPGLELEVVGTGNFTTNLYVAGQQVCQEDGTNCPAGASSSSPWQNDSSLISPIESTYNVSVNVSTLFVDVSSGYVGIGTSNPLFKTHLQDASVAQFLIERDSGTAGDTAEILFKTSTDDTANFIKGGIIFEDSGASNARGRLHLAVDIADDSGSVTVSDAKITIDDSGFVGVGTVYPNATLQIASTAAAGAFFINDGAADPVFFVNGSSDLVGIGTNSPSQMLEISDGSNGITFAPSTTDHLINTTGTTNLTITSNDGSVIIQLGG